MLDLSCPLKYFTICLAICSGSSTIRTREVETKEKHLPSAKNTTVRSNRKIWVSPDRKQLYYVCIGVTCEICKMSEPYIYILFQIIYTVVSFLWSSSLLIFKISYLLFMQVCCKFNLQRKIWKKTKQRKLPAGSVPWPQTAAAGPNSCAALGSRPWPFMFSIYRGIYMSLELQAHE